MVPPPMRSAYIDHEVSGLTVSDTMADGIGLHVDTTAQFYH